MTGGGGHDRYLTNYQTKTSREPLLDTCAEAPQHQGSKWVMGLEPTTTCLEASVSPYPEFCRVERGFYGIYTQKAHVWNLASVGLLDGFTDLILSRQAMNCTLSTLQFCRIYAGHFWHGSKAKG